MNTETKEKIALEQVNTKAKLKKRLKHAKYMLFDPPEFSKGKIDYENKCMYSDDGSLRLQWQLREKPKMPESCNNQQTTVGIVLCLECAT